MEEVTAKLKKQETIRIKEARNDWVEEARNKKLGGWKR